LHKYHRQEILKDFGPEGQAKLIGSAVLVIGAGGLGCPLLQYLVSMGVGRIGIVDGDVVSISNLPRQILFGPNDIGKKKVEVAKDKLQKLNPDINIEIFPNYIDKKLATYLIPDYDIIADCSDNFSTRYLINDACVLLSKPLAFGAVSRYEGQVALFNVNLDNEFSGSYRDLHPIMPKAGEVLNCADAGILGVVAGIIGLLQAGEVIKYLTGVGDKLVNKIMYYLFEDNSNFVLNYTPGINTTTPKSLEEFMNADYETYCNDEEVEEISIEDFKNNPHEYTVIDVRGENELPKWNLSEYTSIEVKNLNRRLNDLPDGKILFICQVGIRSAEAVRIAQSYYEDEGRFFNLKGGVQKVTELMKL
jgi:sulfur-carrier protein adenylyltransferase/sulfurtransferase